MVPPEEEPVRARLRALGIAWSEHRHPPLRTVEEARRLRGSLAGAHVKNLFLRDKKRQLFLLTALEDRTVDLKALRAPLGARKNLSFASPERLAEALAIAPGAVSPLALLNDTEGRVGFFLDAGLRGCAEVNVHPLHNRATYTLALADLLRFCAASGHEPRWLEL